MLIYFFSSMIGFVVFILLDLGSRLASVPAGTDRLTICKQYFWTDGLYAGAGLMTGLICIYALQNGEESVIERLIHYDLPELGIFVSFLIGLFCQFIASFIRKIKNPFEFLTKNDKIETKN